MGQIGIGTAIGGTGRTTTGTGAITTRPGPGHGTRRANAIIGSATIAAGGEAVIAGSRSSPAAIITGTTTTGTRPTATTRITAPTPTTSRFMATTISRPRR